MYGEGNAIHHKETLKVLESVKKIKIGTKVEVPALVKGYEIKLTAIEVDIDNNKAVWEID